jgi:transposase
MEYCGIDLHQKYSQVCVIDENGEVVESARIPTTRAALARKFARREKMRICVEAGVCSPWVSRLLAEGGHELIVCNPRRVRLIAEATLKNDTVDAETLARLVRLDPRFLKPIGHRGEATQLMRGKLRVRRSLIENRTACINTIRGLLASFGYRIPSGASTAFVHRLDRVALPAELRVVIEPLVATLDQLGDQIAMTDDEVVRLTEQTPVANLLQGIPGVGPVLSTAFILCIEDPRRFPKSRDVAPFLGLTPRLRESGETSHHGRITKHGDREVRSLLVQAAHCILRTTSSDTQLKRWGDRLASRVGKRKAVVALARKLAVVMHTMWITGEPYQAFPGGRQSEAA